MSEKTCLTCALLGGSGCPEEHREGAAQSPHLGFCGRFIPSCPDGLDWCLDCPWWHECAARGKKAGE